MRFKVAFVLVSFGFLTLGGSPAESASSPCPSGMVEVYGQFCPRVEQTCLRWLDPENPGVNGPARCAEFSPTKCLSDHTVTKRFCIDRYEFPNKVGELPKVQASWYEMRDSCGKLGKRLCTESEWTLSCEGPGMKAYPYGDGFHRDSGACNIDKPWIDPFTYRDRKVVGERPLSEVDQRSLSGSHPACRSDFGVYDLVGNADEWVVNESGQPYASSLSGGHWALGARNRCRPKTLAHNESFKFYVTGGRCCSDLQR